MEYIHVREALPEITHIGLASNSLLFKVEEKEYAGHYHSNGFFYCDENRISDEEWMADGPNVGRHTPTGRKVSEWRYIREA